MKVPFASTHAYAFPAKIGLRALIFPPSFFSSMQSAATLVPTLAEDGGRIDLLNRVPCRSRVVGAGVVLETIRIVHEHLRRSEFPQILGDRFNAGSDQKGHDLSLALARKVRRRADDFSGGFS
jgi:hypothetical protein